MLWLVLAALIAAPHTFAESPDSESSCSVVLDPLPPRVSFGDGPLRMPLKEYLRRKGINGLPVLEGVVRWDEGEGPHYGKLPIVYNGILERWEIWFGREPWAAAPMTIRRYIPISNSPEELIMPGADMLEPILSPREHVDVPIRLEEGVSPQDLQYLVEFTTPADSFSNTFRLGTDHSEGPIQREIWKHLEMVFRRYEEALFPVAEVARIRSIERGLTPSRCFYLVYTAPGSGDTKMVVRLYDVSPHGGSRTRFRSERRDYESRLPLEIAYPGLQLPERAAGAEAHLYEIGRLAASEDIEKGIWPALREMAWYLDSRYGRKFPESGAVYIAAATPKAKQVYEERFKFTSVFGPKDTPALRGDPSKGTPDEYILRMSLRDFYERYSRGPSKGTGSRLLTPRWRP